jgi:hypothetical protein
MRNLALGLGIGVAAAAAALLLYFKSDRHVKKLERSKKREKDRYCISLPSILLIGDSLTQYGDDLPTSGFCLALISHYSRRATLKNMGLSGYNSR